MFLLLCASLSIGFSHVICNIPHPIPSVAQNVLHSDHKCGCLHQCCQGSAQGHDTRGKIPGDAKKRTLFCVTSQWAVPPLVSPLLLPPHLPYGDPSRNPSPPSAAMRRPCMIGCACINDIHGHVTGFSVSYLLCGLSPAFTCCYTATIFALSLSLSSSLSRPILAILTH